MFTEWVCTRKMEYIKKIGSFSFLAFVNIVFVTVDTSLLFIFVIRKHRTL